MQWSWKQQLVSSLTVISIVLGIVQPIVMAAPAQQATEEQTEIRPPSELAHNLPQPEAVESAQISPFLDPTSLALEQSVGGIIDTELLNGGQGGARLEPLGTNFIPSSERGVFGASAPQPIVEHPAAPNPVPSLATDLPNPHNLAAFQEQSTVNEPDLSEDTADHNRNSSTTVESTIANQTPQEVVQPPLLTLSQSVTTPDVPAAESGLPPAKPAAISDTVDSDKPHKVHLPILEKNGETTPVPNPTVGDEVFITPETGGVLITTDGLVKVVIPPDAYDEPFTLSYTPPMSVNGRVQGFFTLEAVEQNGLPVILNRAAQLSMQLPAQRSGKPLFFRRRAADGGNTVSVGAYIAPSTITASDISAQSTTDEMLSASIYKFGEFTFASLASASSASQGFTDPDGDEIVISASQSLMTQDEAEENPDEGDDGLVVNSYCWMPGTQGGDYVGSFGIQGVDKKKRARPSKSSQRR